jgi:hypothetical protein
VHARDHGGVTWWKSFTTGKSAVKLGGMPHDSYGMTLRSIRQHVVGIYNQLGLTDKDVTKVQTGGPDGDLGSSMFRCACFDCKEALMRGVWRVDEILLSSDKTIAVIDGSGVLADKQFNPSETRVNTCTSTPTPTHGGHSTSSSQGFCDGLARDENGPARKKRESKVGVAFYRTESE